MICKSLVFLLLFPSGEAGWDIEPENLNDQKCQQTLTDTSVERLCVFKRLAAELTLCCLSWLPFHRQSLQRWEETEVQILHYCMPKCIRFFKYLYFTWTFLFLTTFFFFLFFTLAPCNCTQIYVLSTPCIGVTSRLCLCLKVFKRYKLKVPSSCERGKLCFCGLATG